MKELVWVFGTSASGKQTFISNILRDKELKNRLGYKGQDIAACQRSLDYLGHIGQEEIVDERRLIVNDVKHLLENHDVVLVKWQYIDSELKTPQTLKNQLPDIKHHVMNLSISSKENKKRLSGKTWRKEMFNDTEFSNREVALVKCCLDELPPEFCITTLDSSANADYKEI